MNPSNNSPGLMFRSFLTVGSGYVLTQIFFFTFAYLLGRLFFSEYIEFLQLGSEAQQKMMAENPQAAIPVPMFWAMVGLNAVACWGIGWLTAKTAPFARFQHGVFLAVLLFVMFLQIVVADSEAKKWMDLIYMGVLPITILIGANSASRESDADDEIRSTARD
jgi:hypothetical protein